MSDLTGVPHLRVGREDLIEAIKMVAFARRHRGRDLVRCFYYFSCANL